MVNIKIYDKANLPTKSEKLETINFLYEHLEQYGDSKSDIEKCLDYALNITDSFGGFIAQAYEDNKLLGVAVINKTGMSGYIPENILVYIATHKEHRGKGIGKILLDKLISETEGDIALHVEKDNPARFLYEKYQFKTKYLEMRLKKAI